MNRRPVTSSNIASIGWEEAPGGGDPRLEVEFRSGHIFQYLDVPEFEYRNLLGADSVGKYFNLHIKDRYDEERIR